MPLVVLVTNSLTVSWNGAEGACDDIPHDGPHTLVLFLPCCLEPVQMSQPRCVLSCPDALLSAAAQAC